MLFKNKSTFISDPIPPRGGLRFIRIRGTVGGGSVKLLRESDGAFHEYPELVFNSPTAQAVDVPAAVQLQLSVAGCTDVTVDID